MKSIILILSIAILMGACSNPSNQFEIAGNLDMIGDQQVVLARADDNTLFPLDSTQVKQGKFSFRGEIETPEMYYLHFKASDQYLGFFVEQGKLSIAGTTQQPEYSGLPTQALYDRLLDQLRVFELQFEELSHQYRDAMASRDEMAQKLIEERAGDIEEEQIAMLLDFVKTNTESVVAPYVLMNNLNRIELDETEDAMAALDPSVHASIYYTSLNEQVETMRLTAIGRKAPLFEQNDPDGNPVSLDSFRGKYVLLDFWAAWCSPCRKENPNIVAAYEKYKEKGFEVFGVSLDRDRNSWLKAIKDDNLTWTNVSDLNYWNNEASRLYNVSSIPASFLLDPDGAIIAKNLRGQDLHDKLAEIFD